MEALDELDEADRGRPYVLFLKGQTLRAMERYEEAVEPLQQAAELEPDNIHVWLALGWCYKRLGRLDRAIESLEEALAAEPEQAIITTTWPATGACPAATEVAVAYLANALEIDPSYATWWRRNGISTRSAIIRLSWNWSVWWFNCRTAWRPEERTVPPVAAGLGQRSTGPAAAGPAAS